jgi:hypothetical protein
MKTIVELRWHDLRTELPPEDMECVILFPHLTDVGNLYDTDVYTPSNSEFVRINALRRGYTHWFPIPPHPQEEEVKEKIKKMYEHEYDGTEQFYKGFQRATENIIAYLKDLVPDRPSVIRAIEAQFSNEKEKK